MATKGKENVEVIDIMEINRSVVTVRVVGIAPLICNRLAEKAKHELLLPSMRKTAADKATILKHSPLDEYRSSVERSEEEDGPIICLPATAFKGSMRSAALDIPGASKSQIGRLTYIEGSHVQVYGVPEMYMSIVRSADMNKTPDVRTRAIIRNWCAEFSISFMTPNLTEKSVLNLLAAAGEICGVGDFRPGKGAGAYGRFRLVDRDDKDYARIVKTGGRAEQFKSLENPGFFDAQTEELFGWFNQELNNRGRSKEGSSKSVKAGGGKSKSNGASSAIQ